MNTQNASIHKQIKAYFQYLRDIGMDTVFFERDSEIGKLLTNDQAKRYNVTSAIPPPRPANMFAAANKTPPPVKDTNPFAKLSKLRSGDTLGLSKFERTSAPPPRTAKREKLTALYHDVQGCEKCSSLSVAVFGAGSADGRILVIGGAPTAEDTSAKGAIARPFTGETGDLINKLFEKMGVDKSRDVFLTYLQKCGTAFDPELATRCATILDKQIEIIEPKVIVVFGETESNFLLKSNKTIDELRKDTNVYKNIPVIVTYDVPLLIKETQLRYGAWDDMQKVLAVIGGA